MWNLHGVEKVTKPTPFVRYETEEEQVNAKRIRNVKLFTELFKKHIIACFGAKAAIGQSSSSSCSNHMGGGGTDSKNVSELAAECGSDVVKFTVHLMKRQRPTQPQ